MQIRCVGAVSYCRLNKPEGTRPASVSLRLNDREAVGGEVSVKLLGYEGRVLLPGDVVVIDAHVKSGIYTDEKNVKHPYNTAAAGEWTLTDGVPAPVKGAK